MAERPYITEDLYRQPNYAIYAYGDRPTTILRLPMVRARTGLSRATIYRKMKNSEFPRCFRIGALAVGWLESDIDQWIANCIAGGANDN